MKSVLWRVAKRLSCIQDARCLKVNARHRRLTSVLQNFHLASSDASAPCCSSGYRAVQTQNLF